MICCDITEPVCQVRLKIADATEPYQFTDETIVQFLTKHADNVGAAAEELLAFCIAVAAGRARERVDDVEVDWPSIYTQKRQLLSDMQSSSAFGSVTALHCFGGVSKTEMQRVCDNPDSNGPSVSVGEFSNIEENIINYYANYRN